MGWLANSVNAEQLLTQLVEFLPKMLVAVLILLAFWLLYRATRGSLRSLMARSDMDSILIGLLVDKVYKVVLLAFALVMGASQIGINVGAALAGLGVAGVALGFAAKDILANVIAGFTIFMDQPFVSGDYIHVSGEYGRVEEVTLRSTRIRTRQNTYVVLPNSRVVNEVLVNDSRKGHMRIDVPVGIAYKEDIARAREVLLEAMDQVEGLLDAPGPDVVVDELGDSSVNLLARAWLADAEDAVPSRCRIVEACKLALDGAGIEIPFPHLQLFMDTVEDRVVQQVARIPRLASEAGSTGA
ncbi:MAG: mechanosensitive ion channel family protein [Candidatus Fermentibacteraceae bacterium]